MRGFRLGVMAMVAVGMIFSFAGCGGGGGEPAAGPVSINTLDGQTNIPVSSTFAYQFTQMVTTSTVGAAPMARVRTLS